MKRLREPKTPTGGANTCPDVALNRWLVGTFGAVLLAFWWINLSVLTGEFRW
jgi:hypothetical protein